MQQDLGTIGKTTARSTEVVLSSKPNLTLILTRRAYVPDYANQKLLASLSKKFDVTLVVRESVNRDGIFSDLPPSVEIVSFEDEFPDSFSFLADLYTQRYWRRSRSFKIRLLRDQAWESRGEFLEGLSAKNPFLNIARFLRGSLNRRLLVEATPVLFAFTSSWHKMRLPRARSLERAIRSSKPDVMMVPSNAYGYLDVEAIRVSNELGAKSLLCVDNWDNMSSKAVLIRKPTAIAVVGSQSAKHAVQIHQFPENRVFPIGAPRFDVYKASNIPLQSPISAPYIFVAGYSQPFDEVDLVRFVSQVAREIGRTAETPLKVVYRPHPWKERDLSALEKLDNVILDDPFRGSSFLDLTGVAAWMFHAQAVIGAPTTLLLEALLMGKRVAVAAIDDATVLVGPQAEFDNYTHFRELSDVQGVIVCRDQASLRAYILSCLRGDADETDRKQMTIDFLVTRDERGYGTRLVEALDALQALGHRGLVGELRQNVRIRLSSRAARGASSLRSR